MTYNLIIKNNRVLYISPSLVEDLGTKPEEMEDFRSLCENRTLDAAFQNASGIIEYNNNQYSFTKQLVNMANEEMLIYNIEPLEDDLVLFFSIIIHELKNPLSAILGLIQAMESKAERMPREFKISDYTERVKSELKRLNSLLSSAKYIAKPRTSYFVKFDLIEAVKQTVKLFEPEFTENNITVTFNTSLDKHFQRGNKDHIFQIMANMYKNAIESLKHRLGAKISINIKQEEENLVITISDNGTGMNDEVLKQVKNAFTTTKKEGMGMGLYIVDKLVKIYKGRVEIKSKVGHGTVVDIIFPLEKHNS
jgi:signal transduction histidine kinase